MYPWKGLLQEALSKHSKHFRSFNGNINKYLLLYPDNTVVNLLPGSPEFFFLKEYKEDLGKPYSKMSLHLCKLECLQKYEKELKSDDDLAECQGDVNFNLHGASECKMVPVVNESSIQSLFLPFLNANTSADTVANQSCECRELKTTCPTCYLDFPICSVRRYG